MKQNEEEHGHSLSHRTALPFSVTQVQDSQNREASPRHYVQDRP